MRRNKDGRISFLKSWGAIYILLAAVLLLLIGLFYLFTKHFQ